MFQHTYNSCGYQVSEQRNGGWGPYLRAGGPVETGAEGGGGRGARGEGREEKEEKEEEKEGEDEAKAMGWDWETLP